MKSSECLDQAADLLAGEGAWMRGGFARNASGKSACLYSNEAVCFCSIGAIVRVGMSGNVKSRARSWLKGVVGDYFLAKWNDDPNRTQAEVVAAFRKAAQMAREAGE